MNKGNVIIDQSMNGAAASKYTQYETLKKEKAWFQGMLVTRPHTHTHTHTLIVYAAE